jgi:MarC family membrane protein
MRCVPSRVSGSPDADVAHHLGPPVHGVQPLQVLGGAGFEAQAGGFQDGHGRAGRGRWRMDHTFFSALILLLLVLDPLGSLPIFIPIMREVPKERRRRVALREVSLAFLVLMAFMFGGEGFLRVMHLSERSLEVAGGVILLMVAIRMIFSHQGESIYGSAPGKEPFIFPLAVPLLAGPSAMATVLLLASRQPERIGEWVAALAVAMWVCGALLLGAERIRRLVGDQVVSALEKLMGLVLTAIAVEMILAGLKRYFVGGL